MAQGHTEQALDAQTELDGRVGEDVLALAFATCWGVPLHVFVQPDRQRPSGFERGVVLGPVGGLVAGLGPLRFTHAPRLPAHRTAFVQQSPFSRYGELPTDGMEPTNMTSRTIVWCEGPNCQRRKCVDAVHPYVLGS